MRHGLALLFAMGWAVGVHAAVFKWTDNEGRMHYSDLPPAGQSGEWFDTPGPAPTKAEAARQAIEDKLIQSET